MADCGKKLAQLVFRGAVEALEGRNAVVDPDFLADSKAICPAEFGGGGIGLAIQTTALSLVGMANPGVGMSDGLARGSSGHDLFLQGIKVTHLSIGSILQFVKDMHMTCWVGTARTLVQLKDAGRERWC